VFNLILENKERECDRVNCEYYFEGDCQLVKIEIDEDEKCMSFSETS